MNYKLIFRIFLSPFILLWGIYMLVVGSLFPLPIIVILSFFGFIIEPFVYLIRLCGSNVEGIDPFFPTKYIMISHLLGMTVYIWGAPKIMIDFILTGEIFTGE